MDCGSARLPRSLQSQCAHGSLKLERFQVLVDVQSVRTLDTLRRQPYHRDESHGFSTWSWGVRLPMSLLATLQCQENTMPKEELAVFSSTSTRRTVVTTGAKVAYAAPLVAASFKLSAHGAGAVSADGPCDTFVCGNNVPCVDRPNQDPPGCWCFEVQATPGQGRCTSNFYCSPDLTVPCPNGQSDCPSNTTCVTNTCCGQGVNYCAPDCGSAPRGLESTNNSNIPTAAGV